MSDRVDNAQIILSLATGDPFIALKSGDRVRLKLGTANGSPSIELLDGEEHTRAVVGVTELAAVESDEVTRTAESSITLFDRKGRVVWRSPSARP